MSMVAGHGLRLAIAAVGASVAVLLVVLALAMGQGVGGESLGATDAGFDTAPEFTLPTFDGDRFTLAEHADGPVFVYFWASWCGPCEEEAPVIEALWPEYRDRGYTFVGINLWDVEGDADAFVERHGLSFPLVRDRESVYLDYGVQGLPEAFFLKPGLEVTRKYNGALSEGDLRSLLDSAEAS